ncbi:MAG: VWA domain-containing protein, partial [Pseudomonadota bacterium]
LMPGLPVTVTLTYVQTVPRIDGAEELVLPLVVGPRYQPEPDARLVRMDEDDGMPVPAPRPGEWEINALPDYPPVAGIDLPASIARERVSIRVRLASAVPLGAVWSDSHSVTVREQERAAEETGPRLLDIALDEGPVIDNRDFVLRYRLGGAATSAGLLAEPGEDEDAGTFSLMLAPPAAPSDDQTVARELVFVLDTSGSMLGLPVEASKTFMQAALDTLRPDDHFRILRFASGSSEFADRPVRATPANLRAARRYVAGLSAGGGTEMAAAIRRAFTVAQTPDTLRLVVFLTDGYIGNEADVLREIGARIGKARIYALGVGSSVNRYLLEEMARTGRGHARFIDPTEDPHEVARGLAERIATPVLSDIRIDWGTLDATEITPALPGGGLPDLFAGDTLRLEGRYTKPGRHRIVIHGRVRGRAAQLPLDIELPAPGEAGDGAAIPLVWAQGRIADTMRRITALSAGDPAQAGLKAEVTRLGLEHALATRWTSFVAVSERVVNAQPKVTVDGQVPLPMPDGVPPTAYPAGKGAAVQPARPVPMERRASGGGAAADSATVALAPPPGALAQRQMFRAAPLAEEAGPAAPVVTGPIAAPAIATEGFAGGSTPEPETIAGILVLLLGWIGALLRRRWVCRRARVMRA